jgi:hypothetical protein
MNMHNMATKSKKIALVPIPELYLVPSLSMHCVHFKCIGKCVSR